MLRIVPFAIIFLLFLTDKKLVVPENQVFQDTWRVNEGTTELMVLFTLARLLDFLCLSWRPRGLNYPPHPREGMGHKQSSPCLGFWHVPKVSVGLFVFNCFVEGILGTCNKQFHLEVKMNGRVNLRSWAFLFMSQVCRR